MLDKLNTTKSPTMNKSDTLYILSSGESNSVGSLAHNGKSFPEPSGTVSLFCYCVALPILLLNVFFLYSSCRVSAQEDGC